MKEIIKIGQKVIFDPLKGIQFFGMGLREPNEVIGKVIEINEDHRWFSVEYNFENKVNIRTSFNFNDIGENVKLID